ncbi:hypothetical protein AB0F17_54270 [Nonomuraea sp. NPDC026600]|uniref:hypothetical protein n=1 Tax=Nonomuraea sp. NPDC026600 TaxID=3155363 RepID=UPI0033C6F305
MPRPYVVFGDGGAVAAELLVTIPPTRPTVRLAATPVAACPAATPEASPSRRQLDELSPDQPGVWQVVSLLTACGDLLVPHEIVRSPDGHAVGCRRLGSPFAGVPAD